MTKRFLLATAPRIGNWCGLICLATATIGSAQAAPGYSLRNVGLLDTEHAGAYEWGENRRVNAPKLLNDSGIASGTAARYRVDRTPSGTSAWYFDGNATRVIGLRDQEHLSSDGTLSSDAKDINSAGQVVGISARYNGTAWGGQSTWIYDGATTRQIGLTDAAHTRSDGARSSEPAALNAIGRLDAYGSLNAGGNVIGSSQRYDGTQGAKGKSAWLFNGSETVRIGLVDSEHIYPDGSGDSVATRLNSSGLVIGHSSRINGSGSRSAWLYDGTGTVNIGFTDMAHTKSNGYRHSGAVRLNDAGQVAGYSGRYSGSNDVGYSAWLYQAGSRVALGLLDAEHRGLSGYQSATPSLLNESGVVAGVSTRYDNSFGIPGITRGESAWISVNGGQSSKIGLFGAEHTNNFGSRYSTPLFLNSAGHVAGTSRRYNGGSNQLGESLWLHKDGLTREVGFTDADHTYTDGSRNNEIIGLNNSGLVIGASWRYVGTHPSGYLGRTAWISDGATTVDIGLRGERYENASGHRRSAPELFNDAGFVAGSATHFLSNGTSSGQTAWVYDPIAQQTIALPSLAPRPGVGSGNSYITHLTDEGVVLGWYNHYFSESFSVQRLFSWSHADGMRDVVELVEGGMNPLIYDSSLAIHVNSSGQILVQGTYSSSTRASLLTPSTSAPTLSGDFDADGDVDGADFLAWQLQFGASVPAFSGADGNGNGVIDAADLTIWRDNFGNTAGSSSVASLTVPEPGDAAIVACVAIAFAWTRTRSESFTSSIK